MENTSGVWSSSELESLGWGYKDVRAALRAGRLSRLRRGWYAEPCADDRVLRAVRAGGVLGCVSALAAAGAWDASDGSVHLRASHNVGLSTATGIRVCRPVGGELPAGVHPIDDLEPALLSAWRCQSRDMFVVLADSLVDRRMMTMEQISWLLRDVPGAAHTLSRCAPSQSGTETLVRLRLAGRRVPCRSQVWIGPYRVDLLVGERLVIEVDSRAHHTGDDAFRADRERDLALRAMGYIVVRLTFEQVAYRWHEVEPSLLAMIRRGDHWWGARRGLRRAPAVMGLRRTPGDRAAVVTTRS